MLQLVSALWVDFRGRYAALHERRKPLAGVHLACVLGSLLWIAPLFPHALAVLGYRMALMATVYSAALQTLERTPFAFSRVFLAGLLRSSDFHYALVSLLFFFGAPFTMWIVPVLIRSMYYLRILGVVPEPITSSMGSNKEGVMAAKAYLEIYCLVLCLIQVLTGERGVFEFALLSQVMGLRYRTSRESATAWHSIGQLVEAGANHPYCIWPLNKIVLGFKRYLVWMSQPRGAAATDAGAADAGASSPDAGNTNADSASE